MFAVNTKLGLIFLFKRYADKLKESTKTVQNETSSIKDKIAQVESKVSEVEEAIAAERGDLEQETDRFIQMVKFEISKGYVHEACLSFFLSSISIKAARLMLSPCSLHEHV